MSAPPNMHEVMDEKERQPSQHHLAEKDEGHEPAARGSTGVDNEKRNRSRARCDEQSSEHTSRDDRMRLRATVRGSRRHRSFSRASGTTATEAYCDSCNARM